MKRKVLVFLAVCLVFLGALTAMRAEKSIELNISAAASLKDAMLEIQKLYFHKQPNIKINLNFGSSGALQTQIEQGAPADLFISAATQQMDALEKKDLIKKGTRKDILANQLVMIVPKDSALNLKDFKDLGQDKVKKIGIGAPESVPAGQYAQQTFKYLNIWNKLQGKMVYGTDVRAVLTYVETGNVDAGIVYKTDALISDKIKVVVAAPAGSHDPIVYPAAILSNSVQPKEAFDLLTFLTAPEGKAVFEKFGFVVTK